MVHGYTTIEQSKKLFSLGLDPSTADMCYVGTEKEHILHAVSYNKILAWRKEDAKKYHNAPFSTSITPCWSLATLLELMPRIIPNEGILCITPSHKDNGWVVGYNEENTSFPTLIDAAFEMVCWLIEQGHIKVNK